MSGLYKELEAHYHNHCFCEVLSKAAARIAALEAAQELRKDAVRAEVDRLNARIAALEAKLKGLCYAVSNRSAVYEPGWVDVLEALVEARATIADPLVEAALKGAAT